MTSVRRSGARRGHHAHRRAVPHGRIPPSLFNSQIAVPGSWELQGHGSPQYLNFDYPFPINPPFVPETNPTGVYRREFPSVQPQGGTRSFLVVESADSAVYVWLNGRCIGYSQDSRLPAEFEVSCALLPPGGGTNVLVLQAGWLCRWSEGLWGGVGTGRGRLMADGYVEGWCAAVHVCSRGLAPTVPNPVRSRR